MTKSYRKRIILAKIETTEGVDASPTGANAILIANPTITPLAGSTVKRGLVREVLGADAVKHVNSHVEVQFEVEVAGSGAAGTAPAYGVLLRACAMTETVSAGVDVVYEPTSDPAPDSTSIYFNMDGTLHKMKGARGTFSAKFPPNEIPRITFTFRGLWVDPSETAAPSPDFSAFQEPLPITKENTPTFTIHGHAGVLEELSIDFGNQIEHRNRVNSAGVKRVDRQASGTVSFEAPPVSTINFFTIAKADTKGAVQLVHGTAAGNIVQLDMPKVQILEPKYGESQGIVLLQAGLSIGADAGDDEIKLTIK